MLWLYGIATFVGAFIALLGLWLVNTGRSDEMPYGMSIAVFGAAIFVVGIAFLLAEVVTIGR